MPDYKKTEQIYVEQGITNHWKKPLEMLDDELFEAKVIDQNTKAYNQTSDLPVEYRKARVQVNEIIDLTSYVKNS